MEYVTVKQFAAKLGISVPGLYYLLKVGTLPKPMKVGPYSAWPKTTADKFAASYMPSRGPKPRNKARIVARKKLAAGQSIAA